jgi:hypothetical protein
VTDLWALSVAAFIAAAFNGRIALQLWKGNMDIRNPTNDVSIADIPESRLRINSMMPANALGVSAFALSAVFSTVASESHHSIFAGMFLVLGSCSGAAFIVFIGIGISIYFTNKPSRFVPPVLRNRNLQR